jgi:hypothetical protein
MRGSIFGRPSHRQRYVALFLSTVLVLFASGAPSLTVPTSSFNQLASRDGVAHAGALTQAQVSASYGRLPMSFEANHGQTDPEVQFLARGKGYTLFLTKDEAVLSLRPSEPSEGHEGSHAFDQIGGLPWGKIGATTPTLDASREVPSETVLRMKLVGAKAVPVLNGLDELWGKVNYFIG